MKVKALVTNQRVLVAVAVCVILAGLYAAVYQAGGIETLVTHEQWLRDWIERNSIPAFFLGIAIYTTACFVPGTSGKAIAIGWLYGFWQGLILVEVSLVTAALATFLISRYLLRDLVRAKYSGLLKRLDQRLMKRAGLAVLTMRLAHFPYTILNYSLGATSISWRTFVWTTALGMLPGTMACVFAGGRLPTLAELVEQGAWGLLDPWLIAALGASALAAPLVHLSARWWNRTSVRPTQTC